MAKVFSLNTLGSYVGLWPGKSSKMAQGLWIGVALAIAVTWSELSDGKAVYTEDRPASFHWFILQVAIIAGAEPIWSHIYTGTECQGLRFFIAKSDIEETGENTPSDD